MRKVLVCVVLMGLAACSAISSILNPNPNVVAGLESTLAAADSAALVYVNLPTCGNSGSLACSQPAIIASIGKAAAAAFTAVKAAEANETSDNVTAAQNAVTAYQTIISALGG